MARSQCQLPSTSLNSLYAVVKVSWQTGPVTGKIPFKAFIKLMVFNYLGLLVMQSHSNQHFYLELRCSWPAAN